MGNQDNNIQDAAPEVAENAFNQEVTQVQTGFTAEDIAKARKQEKDKVYSTIEKMQQTISLFEQREAERLALESQREAERQARKAEREAEKRAKEEEEMSVKELLRTKEQEWQAKLEQERLEREKAFTLLQKEQEYNELKEYRNTRVQQERDNIMPELLDLINGNSKDEIEQSILGLKERTAKILESVTQAQQQSRKEMVGARVTAPASGPLDNDSVSNSLPGDISNMSMADYIKNRDKLLRSGSNNRGQGLFG
jgi:hypothetical protein